MQDDEVAPAKPDRTSAANLDEQTLQRRKARKAERRQIDPVLPVSASGLLDHDPNLLMH